MEDKKVKLSRLRSGDFVVNEPIHNKKYTFTGAKGKLTYGIDVPMDVYEWLLMSTTTMSDGELVVQDAEAKEQLINAVGDIDEVMNNIHTKEEVEKILNSAQKTMEKSLSKITNADEKKFILSVAKEMKLDSATKRSFIVKWSGIEGLSTDEVFMEEEQ